MYMYSRGTILLFSALALVLAFMFLPALKHAAVYAYEDVFLALDPSAARALHYGNRYFDAKHAKDYDLARAEHLYEKAAMLDATTPLLQHQRARIAFLKSDFYGALAWINAELETNPSPVPESYYLRGLVEGYMGDFDAAAEDYETYLRADPKNWAAINDYAWVLLKADRPLEALVAVDWGLLYWPDNPWLLNSKATALFERGELEKAHEAVAHAAQAVMHVTEEDWMRAYPGNDPLIAKEGVGAFQKAVLENMHTIALALEEGTKSVQ